MNFIKVLVLIFAVSLFTSCDDEGIEPQLAEITGSWQSDSVRYTYQFGSLFMEDTLIKHDDKLLKQTMIINDKGSGDLLFYDGEDQLVNPFTYIRIGYGISIVYENGVQVGKDLLYNVTYKAMVRENGEKLELTYNYQGKDETIVHKTYYTKKKIEEPTP